MTPDLDELLKSQRGLICAQTGHNDKFVLPIQKDDTARRVLCTCSICERQVWKELPEAGYKRFLADLAAGNIK